MLVSTQADQTSPADLADAVIADGIVISLPGVGGTAFLEAMSPKGFNERPIVDAVRIGKDLGCAHKL